MNKNVKRTLVSFIILLFLVNAFLLTKKYLKNSNSNSKLVDVSIEHPVHSITDPEEIQLEVFIEDEIFIGHEINIMCTKIGENFLQEQIVWEVNNKRVPHNASNFLDYTFMDTSLSKIKVCYQSLDRCQETSVKPKYRDLDSDGVYDKDDNCLEVSGGPNSINGCPDSDGDEIIDSEDECPNKVGLKLYNGCPDTDNDGIPDNKDNCPNEGTKGNIDKQGCPKAPPPPPPVNKDSDGDGVYDRHDKCPRQGVRGQVDSQGCPKAPPPPPPVRKDSDGDGILDKYDNCPGKGVRGQVDSKGCPVVIDSDGDGIPDTIDKCKSEGHKGKITSDGCPDRDLDGVPDKSDACPDKGSKGKVDKNGCPEITVLKSRGILKNLSSNDCLDNIKEWQSEKFQFNFTSKSSLELRNISAVSEGNWEATITLYDSSNSKVGNQINNEKILEGVTEINLTEFGVYLENGKSYKLTIEGNGKLKNTSACSNNQSNKQLSVIDNNNFFNIEYKY